MSTKIPFLDLVTPHVELESELLSVVKNALRTASFIGGPAVEGFEQEFAKFCDVAHAIGVSSGTDALRFALLAAGVGPGDIVITVPNTFAATLEAIYQVGATPEFVDVDARTFNMDAAALEKYLSLWCEFDSTQGQLVSRANRKRIAAVVPVHLYGQMADMDAITEIAGRFGIKVVEDACQAHGARYFSRRQQAWRMAGSIGAAAAFSFYPGKNLGACGDAGAVTTNDAEVARRVRILRDHGQPRKYYHDEIGYNGRLDAIQAGFLSVKLKHLKAWNTGRQRAAAVYDELLGTIGGIVTPYAPVWANPVYHLYVIRTQAREELQAHLSSRQIDTGIHYPIPLHLQLAFKKMGYMQGDFPVAEAAASEMLSLPMYPQLRREQQERVAAAIQEFVSMPDQAAAAQAVLPANAENASRASEVLSAIPEIPALPGLHSPATKAELAGQSTGAR